MADRFDLEGKAVLVTGASRGIGRAVARAFAEEGARVGVHYRRDGKAAEETRAGLAGGPHGVYRADLSDPDAVRDLVDTFTHEMNGVDVLVNNAGIYEPAGVEGADYDQWRQCWERTIGTNLLGPANLCYAAARAMMERKRPGRIVNVSSRGAFRGEPEAPAYGASKAGLNALGQSLAIALAPHRITVMTLAPGWVETDMAAPFLGGPGGDAIRAQSPLGRVASPEEIAEAVLFLASGRVDYMTGCIVDMNGASYLRT